VRERQRVDPGEGSRVTCERRVGARSDDDFEDADEGRWEQAQSSDEEHAEDTEAMGADERAETSNMVAIEFAVRERRGDVQTGAAPARTRRVQFSAEDKVRVQCFRPLAASSPSRAPARVIV
jgi:hypothetical protein